MEGGWGKGSGGEKGISYDKNTLKIYSRKIPHIKLKPRSLNYWLFVSKIPHPLWMAINS